MADTLGLHNPLRYRGYVYDTETGLYYLQSRYYDPEVGRFVNADAFASTGQGALGHNLYAYCLNCPIIMTDDTGEFGLLTLCIIGALTGGIINYGSQVFENHLNGKSGAEMWTDVNIGEIAAATFSGCISAIPGAYPLKDIVDAVGSNLIENGVNYIFCDEEFNVREMIHETMIDLLMPNLLNQRKVPKYIRDIKSEAVTYGIKGTKRLNRFLNLSQISNVVSNTLKNQACDYMLEIFPNMGG